MSVVMFVYAFLLFFVLTPGILVYLPPKGSKKIVAGVHALVFAIVWSITHKIVWRTTSSMFEGLTLQSTSLENAYTMNANIPFTTN
jgi:hypothetical protein